MEGGRYPFSQPLPFWELSHIDVAFLQVPVFFEPLQPLNVTLVQEPLFFVVKVPSGFFTAPPTSTTFDMSFASLIDLRKLSILEFLSIVLVFIGYQCKDKSKILLLQIFLGKFFKKGFLEVIGEV